MSGVLCIARSLLSDARELSFYDEVCDAILAGKPELRLRGMAPQRGFELMQLVLCDHPEFYWATCSAIVGGWPARLTFDFPCSIFRTPETEYAMHRAVNAALERLPPTNCQRNFARAVYGMLASKTEYSKGKGDERPAFLARAHTCLGCLIDHRAVCEGIVKATQLLLQRAGIPSMLVSGSVKGNDSGFSSHAWLLYKIGDDLAYMDPTFAKCDESLGSAVTYRYFSMSDEDLRETRMMAMPLALPPCAGLRT